MMFSRSTHLLMVLSLETLTSIIRTGLPVLVELIDQVNSVIIYLSQKMVNCRTRIPGWDFFSPALLDFFLSSDASICSTVTFPPMGNSDHVVVSVFIDFPSNSQGDALFHRIAYDYSLADWDGLCDHLREYQDKPCSSPCFSAAFGAAIVHRNHFFPLYQKDKCSDSKAKLSQTSNHCKRVLEAAKLAYANKTKEFITSQKLGSLDFW